MKSTYLKTLWRTFTKHKARLLSLFLIVLVAVGFISGVGSTKDKIYYSLSEYYSARSVSDLIVKSKSDSGFTAADIEAVETVYGADNVMAGTSLDLSVGEKRSERYYFYDLSRSGINDCELIDGVLPANDDEIMAERSDNVIEGVEVGQKITLDFKALLTAQAEQNGVTLDPDLAAVLGMLQPKEVTVTAIVQSPLTFSVDGEPSYLNGEDAAIPDTTSGTKDMDVLKNIYYVSSAQLPEIMGRQVVPTGDIYVKISDRNLFNGFCKEYNDYIGEQKAVLSAALGDDIKILTLNDNYSFKSLIAYADKVEAIGYIIMAAFLAVTVLVAFSTMTRLLDEERSQIACLKTLGYSSFGIIFKYVLFALVATGAGGAAAYFVGLGITHLIYFVFNYSFTMPPVSSHVAVIFYFVTMAVVVIGTAAATALSGVKLTGEHPANLLRPKPPKAGKKVFLERIPFIWKRLPFRYKSTVRNVLRYKSRFLMTVIAVAVSTALILAGLALLDMCLFGDFGSPAIIGIALVIIVFAGLLTAVVIYTITNINISERKREIATLMVLGYYDGEVAGYIYREIYINTIIGIIFGYPVSVLLMWFVFGALGFGSIGAVSWFMWLAAPVVVLLFTGLITLLLRRRIVGIDMNDSLKAIE